MLLTLFVALLLRDPTLTGWWVIGFDAVLTFANSVTPLAAITFIAEGLASLCKDLLRRLTGSKGDEKEGADKVDHPGEGDDDEVAVPLLL